jgi:exodeoxyribonuclease VII large subunit
MTQRRQRLGHLDARLAAQHPGRALALLKQRLEGLDAMLRRAFEQRLKLGRERLGSLEQRLPKAMTATLKERRQLLQAQVQTLHVVSPLATLGRGYSILLDDHGQAIRRAEQTHTGQRLTARLGEGELQVRVEDNHLTPVTLSLLD